MNKLLDRRIAVDIRIVSGVLILVLSALIYLYQRMILPAHFFNDETTIINLIRYTDLRRVEPDSFVNTAFIYFFLGAMWSQMLLLMAAGLVIFYICRHSNRLIDLMFACVLLLSFALFNLKLSKEVIVILLHLIACYLCSWRISNRRKMAWIAAIYLLYAWQFRMYYVLTVATMVTMHAVLNAHGKLRGLIVLGVLAVCLLTPGDFWNQLQQARDIVNMDREGMSDSKTVFTNVLAPAGVLTALPNAGFAAIRFYFAPFFSLRLQEVALSFTLWMLTFVLFRRHHYTHPLFVLMVANFVVQTFFEPDLGSFFRHLTAYAFCVFGIDYSSSMHNKVAADCR